MPLTGHRLQYCTNTGFIPSKIHIPERLKQLKSCDDEHANLLYSPSVRIMFALMQDFFLQFCAKKFIRFLRECIVNLLNGNLQSIKRGQVTKLLKRRSIVMSTKKESLGSKEETFSISDKGLQPIEVITPPVHNPLSGHGAIFSASCFYLQQKFENPVSYRARNFKVSIFTESHVPNWFV